MHERSQERKPIVSPRTAVALVLGAGLLGCNQEPVEVYTVPKETGRQIASGPPPSAHGQAPPSRPRAQWTVPDGWEEEAPTGMRAGEFTISGEGDESAELVVIPLPGVGDINLQTVNMWRQEQGLPAVTVGEIDAVSETVEMDGANATVVDLPAAEGAPENRAGQRILAAVLSRSGTTWVFKMTGPDELVAAQKGKFDDFLKSVEFGLPAGHPPIAGAGAASPGAPAASAPSDPGAWDAPEGWRPLPASGMRAASFEVQGENGAAADMSVINLSGAAGGLLPNINRWRRQVELPPISDSDLAKETAALDLGGREAVLVNFQGVDPNSGQPVRVLGGIVSRGAETWFYKMTGDPDLVAAQEPAFREFVKSSESKL